MAQLAVQIPRRRKDDLAARGQILCASPAGSTRLRLRHRLRLRTVLAGSTRLRHRLRLCASLAGSLRLRTVLAGSLRLCADGDDRGEQRRQTHSCPSAAERPNERFS